MREFKFRAWDKKTNKIYQITDIDFNNYLANGVCDGEWEEFSTCNLLQYTGLKDKNDVEIYEGDIVKGNYLRGIGVVEWNKYFCKFDISHRMNISPSDVFEVIGNIYENKELLKES